jgi:hypothetical protein
MIVRLMHRDQDFEPRRGICRNARELAQDLDLEPVLRAMAGAGMDSQFLFDAAEAALFSATGNDLDTVLYRQAVLADCLANPSAVAALYALATEALQGGREALWWLGLSGRQPSSQLYSGCRQLEFFADKLQQLRTLVQQHRSAFSSGAFSALFTTLLTDWPIGAVDALRRHLAELEFRRGVLLSARPGEYNESTHFILRARGGEAPHWIGWPWGGARSYTYTLHEQDEAGARILGELRDRAIRGVAAMVARSADHVLSFFQTLRRELAFYIGCLNLHRRLVANGGAVSLPRPESPATGALRFRGLYDMSLSLRMAAPVVGNDAEAGGKDLVVITGANRGGKSTFLRSLGQAQLMMQCGMFVAAEFFSGELCPVLATHFKREEDATMRGGKLDEELERMSGIVDYLQPGGWLLCNESFAATNEREGSELARQIVTALLERRIRVFFVTHLYSFARAIWGQGRVSSLFLRAERLPDGTRSYKLAVAEPLETSYGEDLYRKIIEDQSGEEADLARASDGRAE